MTGLKNPSGPLNKTFLFYLNMKKNPEIYEDLRTYITRVVEGWYSYSACFPREEHTKNK